MSVDLHGPNYFYPRLYVISVLISVTLDGEEFNRSKFGVMPRYRALIYLWIDRDKPECKQFWIWMEAAMQKLLSVCLFFFVIPGFLIAETLTDNFDDNTLDPGLWTPFFLGGVGTAAESNKRLEVTFSGDNEAGGVRLNVRALGDFDFQASYTLLTNIHSFPPDQDESGVGIFAFAADPNPIFAAQFPVSVLDLPPPGGVYIGAEGDLTLYGHAPTSDLAGKFRLTRIGNIYSMYYWGSDEWVLLGSGASTKTGPADLALAVFADGDPTVSAAFDDFSLTADHFYPISEPASLYFPQIADGDGLQTTLTVSNPGDKEVAGTLRFFTPGGSAWSLSINSTVGSEFSFTLPAHGSTRFTTSGTGSIATGWASLESVGVLSGVATFDIRSQDTLIQSLGVLGTPVVKRFMIPADYDSRANVGVSIINTSGSETLTVNLSLVDEQGVVIQTSTDTAYQDIPAHGYVTKYVSQAFPDIPSTFKGNLIGEVSGNGTMAVLGLTQKDALYSAIPIADPSLAVAKRILGEWAFRFGQYAPSFSIRAIEDDSSGSGQIYAWGYDRQGHTSILINWDESRQSYVGIQSNPDYPNSKIYIFDFTNEDTISGCYYYQDQYFPDPLNHPLGNCTDLTGTRIIQ
jgi:hypothetical protein